MGALMEKRENTDHRKGQPSMESGRQASEGDDEVVTIDVDKFGRKLAEIIKAGLRQRIGKRG
jgi:predicted nuclease with TOPRIM domain